jgi:hypothetical protein
LARTVFIAAKSMEHDKRWPALTSLQVRRSFEDTGELEAVRLEGNLFFHEFPPSLL